MAENQKEKKTTLTTNKPNKKYSKKNLSLQKV
jgi:hypothetical protein